MTSRNKRTLLEPNSHADSARPRVELYWPGKYGPTGDRLAAEVPTLPFDHSERLAGATGSPTAGEWCHRLYAGDNLLALAALKEELCGQVTLVYIDPPFATGADFATKAALASDRRVAYQDSWEDGVPGYLSWFSARLQLARELLAEDGSILIHCDARLSHLIGLLCDELFGPGDRGERSRQPGFRNEIVWLYGLGGSSPTCYPKKHDSILWYSKGSEWYFQAPLVPATSRRMAGQSKKCPDYWDIPSINNMAIERTGYPTQKPEALLERVLLAHSRPGDLVLDFFAGSGTTLAVADRLGRRWIGCDESRLALQSIRTRLLAQRETAAEPTRAPIDVYELGASGRGEWLRRQSSADAPAALTALVLDSYGVDPNRQPSSAGWRGDAWVVAAAAGELTSCVELQRAMQEAEAHGAKELHYLAWAWRLHSPNPVWKAGALGLRLFTIPPALLTALGEGGEWRTRTVGSSDFFELPRPRLRLESSPDGSGRLAVTLDQTDVTELDGWAVEWSGESDSAPLYAHWRSQRSRSGPALPTHSAPCPLEGRVHHVRVRVTDRVGNDADWVLDRG